MKLIAAIGLFAAVVGATLYLRHEWLSLGNKWLDETRAAQTTHWSTTTPKVYPTSSPMPNYADSLRKQQQALDASMRNMRHSYTPNIQVPEPPRITMPSVPGIRR